MVHILKGVIDGFKMRNMLAKLVSGTPVELRLIDLAPEQLKAEGISTLALDFDGVLAPHGADKPLPEVENWLRGAVELFGEGQIFILSNHPFGSRLDWFKVHFPGVCFVGGVRKKPYPDGIVKTGKLAGVPVSGILMVDDRLLTGCLAALLAGARPCYIRNPYRSFRKSPLKEGLFSTLRFAERLFLQLIAV